MAIVALSSSGRWIGGAIRNLSRTTVILLVMILAGALIAVWARARIDALLRVDDGAMLTFAIESIDGDCGTPSVYIVPDAGGDQTRYRVLVDFLGGRNRFPMLGGGDTVPVLSLPSERAPGVGLGRGLPDSCLHVSLAIAGSFTGHRFEAQFPGAGLVPPPGTPHMKFGEAEAGSLTIEYRKPVNPSETAALAAVTLEGVADRWQQGSKRVALINEGSRDLNVFVHEETGFQFVNETDSLVRPIGVRRAFVDAYLAGSGGDNAVVVYRRKPTSDIELQHELVGISTIFGIGISLLIEGMIVLVISLASASGARSHDLSAGKETKAKPLRKVRKSNE